MLLTDKLVKFRRQNKPSLDLTVVEKQGLIAKLREYFERREGDEKLEDSGELCQIDPLSLPEVAFGGVSFCSGETAVSHVAYTFADVLFVYPTVPTNFFGEVALSWSSNNKVRTVKVLETRLGAAGVVQGASSSGLLSNVLIPSEGLLNLITNMYEIASGPSPVVFHVSLRSPTQDLIVESRNSGVNAAVRTGFSMLSSGSPQEAHDLAIVAQVASRKLQVPFLHFFETPSGETKVNTLSSRKLEEILASTKVDTDAETPCPQKIAETVKEVMTKLAPTFGHEYKPFSYYGSSEATHLIITTGEASVITEETLALLNDSSVGLLKVHLYSPWSASFFYSEIPATVTHVTVLGLTSSTTWSPLYLNVVATFLENRRNVVIANGKIKSPALRPVQVAAVIENMKQETPRKSFVLIDEEADDAEALPLPQIELPAPAGTTIAFWEVDAGNNSFGTFIASVLSQQDKVDSVSTLYDSYCNVLPAGLVHTTLKYSSSSALPLSKSSDGVSLILCLNLDLFNVYQLLNGLPNGGHLVLNLATDSADVLSKLEASLSPSVKRHLAAHKVKLHVVDAKKIRQQVISVFGENATDENHDDDVVRTILAAAFFKVAYNDASALSAYVAQYTTRHSAEAYEFAIDLAIKDTIAIQVPEGWIDIPIDVNEEETRPVSTVSNVLPHSAFVKSGKKALTKGEVTVKPWFYSAWHLIFKHSYNTTAALRPSGGHGAIYTAKLTKTVRLTPTDYDRNIFHMEIDITGTGLKYDMGEALAVFGHNKTHEVEQFLSWHKIVGTDLVFVNHSENMEVRTCFQIFQQYLDIFGRPTKKFYQQLAELTPNKAERDYLLWIISPEGKEDFKQRVDETITYSDLLREFPSAKLSVEQMLELIPPIKPRHYSIASSMKAHPTSVHLLVVVEDWTTPKGKYREGHTSSYLARLQNPETHDYLLTVSVAPSVMKLPPSHKQPVIMAGLGTGMAPFRAFIQERAFLKAQGEEVGPMALYFGSRHRSKEYLYGEELEAYNASGLLTNLRLAFSRDQVEKVYIQHKLKGDSETIAKWLLEDKGHFYLCGPTWPAGDVYDAIVSAFTQNENKKLSVEDAQKELSEMKELGRYVLEVY